MADKPMSASEAFDENRPLPEEALRTLDWINRKDDALQRAEETLHKIAEFTSEHGGWTEFYKVGKLAGHVHDMARRGLEGPPDGR